MKENKSGSIILVSSINALIGGALEGLYAASKAALHALARALAMELAPDGVRVNVVCPGTVQTRGPNSANRLRKNPNYFTDVARATVPLGRVTTPDDVANTILFLCLSSRQHPCTSSALSHVPPTR
jgi:NAD(P)-dependent dehydrogenase (short-subunit alcohol dehydrogenase family)